MEAEGRRARKTDTFIQGAKNTHPLREAMSKLKQYLTVSFT